MPAGFDMCRKKGGKIRTKKMGKGSYMHICILDGKTYPGEVKKYKKILKSRPKKHMMDEGDHEYRD